MAMLPADFVKNRKKIMTEFNLSVCFNSGIYLLFDNLYCDCVYRILPTQN